MEHLESLPPYTYRWDEICFPLGADSLALGEFCTLRKGDKVLDLGCGAGLLLLLCARREQTLVLQGVERSPEAARYARQNLTDNALEGEILTGDIRELLLPQGVDLVVSNPPWYREGSGKEGGPGRMEDCTFSEWCLLGAKSLRPKGRFALVHAPERLVDLLSALRKAGIEPKRLQFCRGRQEKRPYAVLLEGVKGGNPGLEILPDRLPE